MDQNSAQPQQPPIPFDLIKPEDLEGLFKELHMENLPADKKEELFNTMIDTVMDRVLLRIESQLSEENKKKLDEVMQNSTSDQDVAKFLVSITPNMDQLTQEEIAKYKDELKLQISTIINTMDQEAAKLPDTETPTTPAPVSAPDVDQNMSNPTEADNADDPHNTPK